MIFSLDVRRARKGDCLLLHFGSSDEPGLVLIDGGPKAVYAPHLKPRLMEIRKARKLDAQSPLPVDLLMISHVDDDHMQGILDLTKELRAAAPKVPFVKIRRLWHNSFDNIVANDTKELTAQVTAQFGPASVEGALPDDAAVDAKGKEREVVVSTVKVLASIQQGAQLRRDAEILQIEPNPEFEGKLIRAAKDDVPLTDDLSFTVAGPMEPELKKLQKKHADWLKSLEKKGLTPEKALAEYADESVPNLSSLVVIAKAGGKTMMLTGDARGDKILTGLELVKAVKKGGKLHVDILKVPHHGSSRNLETDFFERITADHYVFSGDGEHGNPERKSLKMLLDARKKAPFQVHLTYPIDELDAGRKKDWEKAQATARAGNERRKAKGEAPKPVPSDWDSKRQGLAALLKKPLAAGQKIHIVAADKPHVIDLLDPLGF
jgi:hypothetical protein